MNKEKIMAKYPSICYGCDHARKPASDENLNKGYVGCCEYLRQQNSYLYIKTARELAEGWVDLHAAIFGTRSGTMTNMQLMTLEVSECDEHKPQQS